MVYLLTSHKEAISDIGTCISHVLAGDCDEEYDDDFDDEEEYENQIGLGLMQPRM